MPINWPWKKKPEPLPPPKQEVALKFRRSALVTDTPEGPQLRRMSLDEMSAALEDMTRDQVRSLQQELRPLIATEQGEEVASMLMASDDALARMKHDELISLRNELERLQRGFSRG